MSEQIKFGTDGWRAVIGKDFNLRNVETVAQAISDFLLQDARNEIGDTKVAVGYDRRRLSPQAARIISQVLAANRIKVMLSDRPLPTQAISYVVKALKYTAGVMITASHNPPRFNGIKIKGAFGGSVEKEITDSIESFIFKHRPAKISLRQAQKRNLLKRTNFISVYLKFLRSYLDVSVLNKGNLRILVDPMHGTANSYIAMILKDTPFRVTTIHNRHDFLFGGTKPEPIESCLRKTSFLMRKRHFDLGLANDGDADRIAALDSRGRFINPQQIIALLLLHFIRYRRQRGAVVKTISGTALLERIAKKYRLKVYETPVGFKHISYLMQKKDVLIGGEEGGGIGFKNYLPERDGILAGLLLLEMLVANNKSLEALLADMQREFGKYVYLRRDLRCNFADKYKVRAKLTKMRKQKTFFGTKIIRIKDYDGLKFYMTDNSWILFRLSGTEPILRIYAEANSKAKTKKLITAGKKLLNL